MWWPAVSFCLLSLASLTNCQDQQAGLDYSEEDYSTKLQQFLLQKIKEAETWTGEEEFENLSEGKRGRQDLTDDDDEDDDDEQRWSRKLLTVAVDSSHWRTQRTCSSHWWSSSLVTELSV